MRVSHPHSAAFVAATMRPPTERLRRTTRTGTRSLGDDLPGRRKGTQTGCT